VVFLLAAGLLVQAEAQQLDFGITASRVWENHDGAWRNIRLHLTFSYSATAEVGFCEAPDGWRFGFSYYDHLVVQNLDDPSDRGRAIPTMAIEEYPDDGVPGIGRWTYGQRLEACWTHVYPPPATPAGCCDSSLWSYYHFGEATVHITLPNCGKWRIFYVVDVGSWNNFCGAAMVESLGVAQCRTVMVGCRNWGWGCAGIDTNLVGYLWSGAAQIRFVDVDLGECPEPPPQTGDVTASFIGYLKPNGQNGEDWLPTPGDSIGLVFGFHADPPPARYEVAYHIWDMTMWRGECMNSPRYTVPNTDPQPTGFEGNVEPLRLDTFRYWDFTVGQPQRYIFYVRDKLSYVATTPANPWRRQGDTLQNVWPVPATRLENARPLFKTHIIAFKRTDQRRDTLWLRAHDYAAHCLVTPEVGGGKDRRMRGYYSPYHQELWTITVPYDYDGYTEVGVSYGDYMADRWEESHFPHEHYDIRYVYPFFSHYPRTEIADRDSIPTGRDIDGDGFCNFAEYRGLMLAVDSTDTRRGHRHRRLDPTRKTVVVHVRSNMDNVVRAQIPGYIYKLPEAEILFTDSIRFSRTPQSLTDQGTIEQVRFHYWGRDVNFNRAGAGLWYPGFAAPITYPMPQGDTIRAVTFWNWTVGEAQALANAGTDTNRALGATSGFSAFHASQGRIAFVPVETQRCLVNLPLYNRLRDWFYAGDPARWQQDFPRSCKRTIAHEFGHTVGMMDTLRSDSLTGIMCGDSLDTHGFVITASDSAYSDTSRAQFSVKEATP
jgi:hypothetical protein